MLIKTIYLQLFCLFSLPLFAKNNYPLVFQHGWMGWGDDGSLGGLNYWGGKENIPDILTKLGFTSYTIAVGPVSSSWDRACEAYAFIKGGRVDYGAYHSKLHKHKRYGRYFPGIYPTWGDDDKLGNINKVHFIGHSQAVQSFRTLIELLHNGNDNEINYSLSTGEVPHELFLGGKEWVHSLTSISGVMDGTTLTMVVESTIPHVVAIFGAVDSFLKRTGIDNYFYDLKLDQWDFKRAKNEDLSAFIKRLISSPAAKGTDQSLFDLSLEGSQALNEKTSIQPHIYYFSISTSTTQPFNKFALKYIPTQKSHLLLKPTAIILGNCTSSCSKDIIVDKSWLDNDGVVNTRSTYAPRQDPIVNFNDNSLPQPGVWNHLGVIKSDHLKIVGFLNRTKNHKLVNFYKKIAIRLADLPQ